MSDKRKSLLEQAQNALVEQALIGAQIMLLSKLHPDFKKELKALMAKYSKKPNPIKDIKNFFDDNLKP